MAKRTERWLDRNLVVVLFALAVFSVAGLFSYAQSSVSELSLSVDDKILLEDFAGLNGIYLPEVTGAASAVERLLNALKGKKVSYLSCDDPDSKDSFVKGEIKYQYQIFKRNKPLGGIQEGSFSDVCRKETSKKTKLTEYYCKGNEPVSEEITCKDGCKDGACLVKKEAKPVYSCVDSDGGKDYSVKGYVKWSGDALIHTDSCTLKGDTGVWTLHENYCGTDNTPKTVSVECDGGCKDGACVKEEGSVSDDGIPYFKSEPVTKAVVGGLYWYRVLAFDDDYWQQIKLSGNSVKDLEFVLIESPDGMWIKENAKLKLFSGRVSINTVGISADGTPIYEDYKTKEGITLSLADGLKYNFKLRDINVDTKSCNFLITGSGLETYFSADLNEIGSFRESSASSNEKLLVVTKFFNQDYAGGINYCDFAVYEQAKGKFEALVGWVPTKDQVGKNPVKLQVTDGTNTAEQSFEIGVVDTTSSIPPPETMPEPTPVTTKPIYDSDTAVGEPVQETETPAECTNQCDPKKNEDFTPVCVVSSKTGGEAIRSCRLQEDGCYAFAFDKCAGDTSTCGKKSRNSNVECLFRTGGKARFSAGGSVGYIDFEDGSYGKDGKAYAVTKGKLDDVAVILYPINVEVRRISITGSTEKVALIIPTTTTSVTDEHISDKYYASISAGDCKNILALSNTLTSTISLISFETFYARSGMQRIPFCIRLIDQTYIKLRYLGGQEKMVEWDVLGK